MAAYKTLFMFDIQFKSGQFRKKICDNNFMQQNATSDKQHAITHLISAYVQYVHINIVGVRKLCFTLCHKHTVCMLTNTSISNQNKFTIHNIFTYYVT